MKLAVVGSGVYALWAVVWRFAFDQPSDIDYVVGADLMNVVFKDGSTIRFRNSEIPPHP